MVGMYSNQQLHGSRAGLMSPEAQRVQRLPFAMLPLRDRFANLMTRVFGGKPNA